MTKMIDVKGMIYWDWTVIERAPCDKYGNSKWICKCKCGNTGIFRSSELRRKHAKKNCGCSNSWIGKKFGRLEVIKKVSGQGNYAAKFFCKCDCGIEKTVWGGSLGDGSTISCGCFRSRSEEHSCITIIMRGYQTHAKKKGIEFRLSREDFTKLVLDSCFYCGRCSLNVVKRSRKLSHVLTLKYSGIDRVDNDKDYTKENCVPCCKTCNLMKREMNFHDWKKHMELILENLQDKENIQTPAMAG